MANETAAADKAAAKAAEDQKAAASKTATEPARDPGKTEESDQPRAFRVDRGESIPTPPIKTATDNG